MQAPQYITSVFLWEGICNPQHSIGSNNDAVVQSLKAAVDKAQVLKDVAGYKSRNLLQTMIQYINTPRDKQIVKALVAELTNVSFAAQMQGVQSR